MEEKGEKMTKKIGLANQNQHDTTSVCIPLYRLQVVKEPHSALYGAPRLSQSSEVCRFLRAHFDGRPHEEFLVLFLDAKNAPIGYQIVSVGSLTLSIVHPREALCAVSYGMVSPFQTGRTWRKVLGSTAYLEGKPKGDKSMLVTQGLSRRC